MGSETSPTQMSTHTEGEVPAGTPSLECSQGCGLRLVSSPDREHNCIEELKTSLAALRAEMVGRMESQRREMEAQFDSQKDHMQKKEKALQSQIKALRQELGHIGDRLSSLLDVEKRITRELDRMTSERAQILDLLDQERLAQESVSKSKDLESVSALCQTCLLKNKGKVTNV